MSKVIGCRQFCTFQAAESKNTRGRNIWELLERNGKEEQIEIFFFFKDSRLKDLTLKKMNFIMLIMPRLSSKTNSEIL